MATANPTAAQCKQFIETIAPIVQKYAKKYGYKVVSPIIAQACLESKYGFSGLAKYHNYFGMKCGSSWKGKSVAKDTKEEYTVGKLTNIKAAFRAYDSMEEGIEGYFKFISTARYSNLLKAQTPQEYLTMIKNDGYATSSKYVTNNMNVVTKYKLTKYDTINPYYPTYKGTSTKIDIVLKAIGVPATLYGSVAKRSPIALANKQCLGNDEKYSGTASQNLALVKLAKAGKLRRPN